MDAVDLRRVAVVTRRFSELRGLFAVALGLWLFLLPPSARMAPFLSTSFLVTIVLLRGYYAHRFGRIERRDDRGFWFVMWIGITTVMIDQATYGHGVPSAFFFAIAAWSAWVVFRDWPFRILHCVLAATALYASATFAGAIDDATRGAWGRVTLRTVATALVIAGMCDHRLMATTLRGESNSPSIAADETT